LKLCFATNNENKIKELQSLLGEDYSLLSLEDIGCIEELEETKETIEGNSEQKAEYVYDKFGVNVFADDTGLEVKSLNGEPGVKSARYAGPDRNNEANIDLLLKNLDGFDDRSARFKTVITLFLDGNLYQFEGIVEGEISHSRMGNKGFGYDAVFIPDGFNKSFAEMTMERKNQISHRAIAVKKLVDFLKQKTIV